MVWSSRVRELLLQKHGLLYRLVALLICAGFVIITPLFLSQSTSLAQRNRGVEGYSAQGHPGQDRPAPVWQAAQRFGPGAYANPKLDDPLAQPRHWNEWGHPAGQYGGMVQPSDVITNNWTNVFPILYDVSTVSTSEAWAAGEYGHLVHYTGGAWVSVDPPSMRGLSLTGIHMLSSTSGWVAGGARVFHYDGNSWIDMSAGLGTNLFVGRVYPLSDNNVWGVGTRCSGGCLDTVVHWNGTNWSATGPTFTSSTFFTDIAMTGPSDGWVVASDINANTSVVLRYDGTSWTQVTGPPGATTLLRVSSPSPGEAWMISGYNNSVHHIYRYSGGTWTTYGTPDGYEPYGISMISSTEGYVSSGYSVASWNGTTWTVEYTGRWFYDVSAVSGRAWAVGRAETIVSRTTGPTWTFQRGGPTPNFLFAVSTLPNGDAWAVGQLGTVVRYTGGAWSPVTTTLAANLFGVQALSSNEVYVVGDHVVARCGASGCSQVATPTAIMAGVFMTGSEQGWAVGTDGSTWQDNGGTWAPVTNPGAQPLYSVAMDSPGHGWAGGGTISGSVYTPELLEYTGSAWVDRTSTLPSGSPVIYGIGLDTGGASGWAVGTRNPSDTGSSAILRLSGGSWVADHTSPAISLFGVSLDANNEASAIAGEIVGGGIGVVGYRLSGGTWHQQSMPVEWCCQAGISLVPSQGGWSVGPLGNIMHFTPPGLVTPTPTATTQPTATVQATDTPIPTFTVTPQPSATPTLCPINFSDVQPSDYFYEAVQYLYCHEIISGYADGTFRPYNYTTRGQLCKIVVLAEGWNIYTPPAPTFSDVPISNPFYSFVETAYHQGVISGYADGTFRPGNNVTRAQLCKIVVLAETWADDCPTPGHFSDVPPTDPFFCYVETAYSHGIISGYADGTFKPGNPATRGQICKIVYAAIRSGQVVAK